MEPEKQVSRILGIYAKFTTHLRPKSYTIAGLFPPLHGKDLEQGLDQPDDFAVNFFKRARGIDDLDAGRMGAGDQTEALLDAAVEGFACAVETRGGRTQTAWVIGRIGALLDLAGVEVEENGEVGKVSLGGDH